MAEPTRFRCPRCTAEPQPAVELRYRCEGCGHEALEVQLDLHRVGEALEPAALRRRGDRSLWRYRELLPVAAPTAPSGPLGEVGGTPLYAAPRAAARLGLGELWIKDDGRLPTGSLKDRASAVVAVHARALGHRRLITASTGNAGVAIAAMARAAGIEPLVLVPERAPRAKITQLAVFGATTVLVRGSYDDAFAVSRLAAERLGIYCRNTAYNPLTAEGKKTAAFEICEQLTARLGGASGGGWSAPDRIYLPVGDGNIISGMHKGLRELLELGWITGLPRLFGVQAAGSAAIARAFERGGDDIEPVVADTVADSIAADRPADGWRALRAARDSGGGFVVVSDEQILAAIGQLGRDAQIFAEPAAAAAYAGLLAHAEAGQLEPAERVVLLVTGNGLKDVAAAARACAPAPVIEPKIEQLTRLLAEQERA